MDTVSDLVRKLEYIYEHGMLEAANVGISVSFKSVADLLLRQAGEIERLQAECHALDQESYMRLRDGQAAEALLREAGGVVRRARNVLNNMAMENKGAWWPSARWPIHHEPLRSDAKNVVPVLDAFLAKLEATDAVRERECKTTWCDCERSHNGLGLTGRECDCPPGGNRE